MIMIIPQTMKIINRRRPTKIPVNSGLECEGEEERERESSHHALIHYYNRTLVTRDQF